MKWRRGKSWSKGLDMPRSSTLFFLRRTSMPGGDVHLFVWSPGQTRYQHQCFQFYMYFDSKRRSEWHFQYSATVSLLIPSLLRQYVRVGFFLFPARRETHSPRPKARRSMGMTSDGRSKWGRRWRIRRHDKHPTISQWPFPMSLYAQEKDSGGVRILSIPLSSVCAV